MQSKGGERERKSGRGFDSTYKNDGDDDGV
jgi:hypothetical protein